MPLSALAPTGNRVRLESSSEPISSFFPGYDLTFCASGTAALGLAIQKAVNNKVTNAPEVILPAYGCPDLVAAAVFAGAKPILVDLQKDSPWMDLDMVRSAINSNTIAVVGVTFLGIRERLADLRKITEDRKIMLIEDSAQWCPGFADEGFQSELVILSFGRGKPVSMLGGGLLLTRGMSDLSAPSELDDKNLAQVSSGVLDNLRYRIKANLFNIVLHPFVYGSLSKLPFLSIGETRYKPLDEIEDMPAAIYTNLGANIARYQSNADRSQQIRDMLTEKAFTNAGIFDLGASCGLQNVKHQLRFLLLFSSRHQRDKCLSLMNHHGLGASTMYGNSLNNIEQISTLAELHQGDEVAQDFAARVLTLPTHEFVTEHHLNKVRSVLHQVALSS